MDLFQPIISTALATAALAIVVLGILGYRQAKSFIQLKGYESVYNQFIEYAHIVIRALEQKGMLAGWDGPRKKQLAVTALKKAASYFGLTVSDDMLDAIIEGAVQIMNAEMPKLYEGTELDADLDKIVDMDEVRGAQ